MRWDLRTLWRDESGQAMTEFIIVAAVMVAVAAYLYYPDNVVFRSIRLTYDKTAAVVGATGP